VLSLVEGRLGMGVLAGGRPGLRVGGLGGRMNNGRRGRDCEGSCKADKKESRDDFQLHIVSFLL
jgi:hypothetical protein